jgi:signal transduction histidine kinase
MQDTITILLVDDEPRNLDALEAILDDASYRLLRAGDADRALKLLLEDEIAAIVLDVKMPGVSGFDLARVIKGTKRFRHIPIVFLTAYLLDDEDIVTGYGTGAVDYLTKPVNPQILRCKVAVLADLFRKTRALAALNAELEARVRQRTAELEHANRMKDEFLATMSHELRTPLNAMLGWAAILKQNPGDLERIQRGIEVIERNARAQERLVTDLLDISRIVSGKLHLTMTEFSLASAIQAAADVVRHAADAKGVRLAVCLDPEIGSTMGDAGRVQQVVWNLLVNAIRYTPAGGLVTVRARREGSNNVIGVEDTGIGISSEHLPHIFERFRQVDSSTTRAHGGLGLGLALVRHLVETHGGTVQARSDGLGRGSTFIVSLPIGGIGVASADSAQVEAVKPGAGAEPDTGAEMQEGRLSLRGVRVLVVEDDADALELLRVMLEEAGADVVGVTSARAALEARGLFDVIISDIGMPEMDGYTFVRRLRSQLSTATIPAIALSAYARIADVERALAAGYQQHLSKPVESVQLVATVRQVVHCTPQPGPEDSPPTACPLL